MPFGDLSLEAIDENTLILIFSYLPIPSILSLRRTCKTLRRISILRIVWRNACEDVLSRGYPFPTVSLSSIADSELEQVAKRSFLLGRRWEDPLTKPQHVFEFDANSSTCIEEVRFLPGRNWLLTVSMGIWSMIVVWNLDFEDGEGPAKITEWNRKGAIFSGLAINTSSQSEATLAVSLSTWKIEILSLTNGKFHSIWSIDSQYRPILLEGDILAICDDTSYTVLWNWREETCATLHHESVPGSTMWQLDRCMQCVFAFQSVLVVRARSIHLFPMPVLKKIDAENPSPTIGALARHTFGWVDGISVSLTPNSNPFDGNQCVSHDPVCILIRAETDDPWAQEQHNLRFFVLEPNPDYSSLPDSAEDSPYLFPPVLRAKVTSIHGSLRCADIKLQPNGTAVWVHPRHRTEGLAPIEYWILGQNGNTDERLLAAVFPRRFDTLAGNGQEVAAKTLYTNKPNDWVCLDYREDTGQVAVGSNSGSVTVLYL